MNLNAIIPSLEAKAQQNVLCIPMLHIKWSIINKLDPRVGYS
jgi:hypothetical protein